MIYLQAHWLLVIAAVIKSGLALRCWKCSSHLDSTCRDFFNTTRILLNHRNHDNYNYGPVQQVRTDPHLEECDEMHTSTHAQFRNVCLKRVLSVPLGPNLVIRECRIVKREHRRGACPEDIPYGRDSPNLEFCGTCEYEGCNSASKSSLIFIGLVPAVILLLGK